MKFTLNGALTIGTLDGANVEIREEVGEENFFLFGLRSEEVMGMRGSYNPRLYYAGDPELGLAVDQILSGCFSPGDPALFSPIVNSILDGDRFFVMADYASYVRCQEAVSEAYLNAERWNEMAVLNVARSGKFSSDRAIREYAEKIWGLSPVKPLLTATKGAKKA